MYKKKHYGVALTITTIDGKEYRFKSNDFRNENSADWLHHMSQIKDHYPERMITCDSDHIELLIEDRNFNESELALLNQLFNMEP